MNAREGLDRVAELLAGVLSNGAVVVAFNLSYDWTVLDRELRRHELPTIPQRVGARIERLVDPYVLDKAVHRYRRGSRRLQPMCEHYGVTGITDWHKSESDALAAVLVAERIVERYPWLFRMGPARLYESQVRWKQQQAESLQAYFRNPRKSGEKYNPDAVVNGEWPLQGMAVDYRDNESAVRRDEETELVLTKR